MNVPPAASKKQLGLRLSKTAVRIWLNVLSIFHEASSAKAANREEKPLTIIVLKPPRRRELENEVLVEVMGFSTGMFKSDRL